MLIVGETLPGFRVPALVDMGHGVEVRELAGSALRGRWAALLYWPVDFGHLCPALAEKVMQEAAAAPATTFVAATTGVVPARLAQDWRGSALAPGLQIAVDETGELAAALGLSGARRRAARVTIVADPRGLVRWVNLSDISPSRDLRQTIAVLRALQVGVDPQDDVSQGDASLIAMCAWCRRLRDTGGWHSPESYIRRRTGCDFTHGICHDCMGGFHGL